MDYRVVVTKDAEEDLERFIKYLIAERIAKSRIQIMRGQFHVKPIRA